MKENSEDTDTSPSTPEAIHTPSPTAKSPLRDLLDSRDKEQIAPLKVESAAATTKEPEKDILTRTTKKVFDDQPSKHNDFILGGNELPIRLCEISMTRALPSSPMVRLKIKDDTTKVILIAGTASSLSSCL